ncbi:MAG: hypothetical protein JW888_04415, partial [Pirellulales bacterium]|nr:hypothetical protein [Pirellulales bacterium]
NREKLDVVGMSCSVGRGHGWLDYLCRSTLRGRLPWYAFLEEAPASEAGGGDEAPIAAGPDLPTLSEEPGVASGPAHPAQ